MIGGSCFSENPTVVVIVFENPLNASHLLSGKINKIFRVLTTLSSERGRFTHNIIEIVEFLENFPTSLFVSKLLLLYKPTVCRRAFILI